MKCPENKKQKETLNGMPIHIVVSAREQLGCLI
jgi:hypothetical protein